MLGHVGESVGRVRRVSSVGPGDVELGAMMRLLEDRQMVVRSVPFLVEVGNQRSEQQDWLVRK